MVSFAIMHVLRRNEYPLSHSSYWVLFTKIVSTKASHICKGETLSCLFYWWGNTGLVVSYHLTEGSLCWWPEEWESLDSRFIALPLHEMCFLNQDARFAFGTEGWGVYHWAFCSDSGNRKALLLCSFFVFLNSVCHCLKLVPPVSTGQFHCEDEC
jgi:hypothetical protein